jgi:hypothetical protein
VAEPPPNPAEQSRPGEATPEVSGLPLPERSPAIPRRKFPSEPVITGVFSTLIAASICKSGWDTLWNNAPGTELFWKGVIGFGCGLVIGIAGWSYSWWSKFLGPRTRRWIREEAWKSWVPLAIVLLFVFEVGPVMYRRPPEGAVPSRPSENPSDDSNDGAALQTQLNAMSQRLRQAEQDRDDARRQLAENQRLPSRIPPLCAVLLFGGLTSEEVKKLPRTLVVIGGTSASEMFTNEMQWIFNLTVAPLNNQIWVPVPPPNYDKDLDAPKITGQDIPGITIHGRGDAANLLNRILSQYFKVHKTEELPEGGIRNYYNNLYRNVAGDSIVWLQFGSGFPLQYPGCRD